MSTVIFHCPFCAEENLRPVEVPRGAWHCLACARVFSVSQHRVATEHIPGRLAEEAGRG